MKNSPSCRLLSDLLRSPGWRRLVCLWMIMGALVGGGTGCRSSKPGLATSAAELHFPIGVAQHPSGKFLYVVNSNFDIRYFTGSVQAIDLERERFAPQATVQVGSFAGNILLNAAGTRAYLPVRGDDSLTYIKINDHGERLECTDANLLSVNATFPECGGAFVIGAKDQSDSIADDGAMPLGDDPFGAALDEKRNMLYVVNLRDGDLTAMHLDENGDPAESDKVDLPVGSFDVAVSPLNGTVMVTNRFDSSVYMVDVTFDAATGAFSFARRNISLARSEFFNDWARGVVFGTTGQVAYLAHRAPARLVAVETSLNDEGAIRGNLITAVPVGEQVTDLVVVPASAWAPELVYLPSFIENKIYVVDAESYTVRDIIPTGVGPYGLARTALPVPLLYVTNFEDDSISVIDLDPTRQTYHQVIKTWTNESLQQPSSL